jgi:hypothetical protein
LTIKLNDDQVAHNRPHVPNSGDIISPSPEDAMTTAAPTATIADLIAAFAATRVQNARVVSALAA